MTSSESPRSPCPFLLNLKSNRYSRQKPRTSCRHHRPSPARYPLNPSLFIILILILPRSQYRTGKTLGSGTYAIVKEAVHIKTGTYYACKVINKKLMEGREHMVDSFLQPIASCPDRQSNHPAGQERDCRPQEDIQVSSQYCHLARLLRGTFDIFTIASQPSICHQTAHNLYLCFDLCTGGELFDRICAKGNYYEKCVSRPFIDSC